LGSGKRKENIAFFYFTRIYSNSAAFSMYLKKLIDYFHITAKKKPFDDNQRALINIIIKP